MPRSGGVGVVVVAAVGWNVAVLRDVQKYVRVKWVCDCPENSSTDRMWKDAIEECPFVCVSDD